MGGAFRMTEVRPDGSPIDDGTVNAGVFVWTEANQALPEDGWKTRVEQRIKVTHYNGSDDPTFQISGPMWSPQEIRGLWADRHGGRGFAIREKEKLIAVAQRGNLVRIEHEEETFYGYVKWGEPDRRNGGEIRYAFEFWPSRRRVGLEASASSIQRSANPRANRTPMDLLAATEAAIFELQIQADDAPLSGLAGRGYYDVGARLGNLVNATASLRRSIELQVTSPDAAQPAAAALSLAAGFGEQRSYATDILPQLAALSSADVVAWESSDNFCGYEAWARVSNGQALLLILEAWEAERELRARAQPGKVRIHYPYAGEHLYSIARFYNVDPWEIAAKNGLETLVFEGTEAIEIPESAAN